jgi:hypothetical protein
MSAKHDVQIGLNATVVASQDEVLAACTQATTFLGKHVRQSTSPAEVKVAILPGLVTKISVVSPIVAISLTPGDGGSIQIRVRIERWKTVQSRFLLVPIGPKRLVGKGQYLRLLTSLEQELRAIDRGRRTFQRVGANH